MRDIPRSLVVLIPLCAVFGNAHAEGMDRSQRHAALSKIAQDCNAPEGWITADANGEAHFQPPRDAPYEKVYCVISGLREANLGKLGLVNCGGDAECQNRP